MASRSSSAEDGSTEMNGLEVVNTAVIGAEKVGAVVIRPGLHSAAASKSPTKTAPMM